jgi:hypothetical protein
MHKHPPEPWHAFFSELDSAVNEPVRLDCMGGFVITQLYGLDRTTADVDVFSLGPRTPGEVVSKLGARGSPLHNKYKIYLDRNSFVANVPENYEERLIDMFPGCYEHLLILGFERYDLALSKLERNDQKDRDDVRFLAQAADFDLKELERRYLLELRPVLPVPKREDLTLQLWIEMIQEDQKRDPVK